jgi:acyl dehydratase
MSSTTIDVDGPFYDDLNIGDVFDSAPAIRLTDGLAAAHHAIVGGRLRLAFDDALSAAVTGRAGQFAAPAFVWDVAIGQSTLVTQRAIANLFYRGLVFGVTPAIGDTLRTVTTIVGLRPASSRPGRSARGLVTMRIATSDQEGRAVLDFHRCALLPSRRDVGNDAAQGETEPPRLDISPAQLSAAVAGWNIAAYRQATPGPHFDELLEGTVYRIVGGDVVSSAPELARLTMNLAMIHHDRTISGKRLVYGGHTIGLAAAQVTRALPSLVTIIAWQDCDHLGPVHEGDTLHSTVSIEGCDRLPGGGGLAHLRSQVRATDAEGNVSDVLDWRLTGLFA